MKLIERVPTIDNQCQVEACLNQARQGRKIIGAKAKRAKRIFCRRHAGHRSLVSKEQLGRLKSSSKTVVAV